MKKKENKIWNKILFLKYKYNKEPKNKEVQRTKKNFK